MSFSVRNFKSIKETITLNMLATDITDLKDSLINKNHDSYLPLVAIYGPNGGGKSNVLEAFSTLFGLVVMPVDALKNASKQKHYLKVFESIPFSFSEETLNQPTSYEVMFMCDNREYKYELDTQLRNTKYEHLSFLDDEGNPQTIFEFDIEYGINVNDEFLSFEDADSISSDLTFLSYLFITKGNNRYIKEVKEWFMESIADIDYSYDFDLSSSKWLENELTKKLGIELLNNMGINISNMYTAISLETNQEEVFTERIINGVKYTLTLQEESCGTKKLFYLIPHIVLRLLKGDLFIIDEFDASLHPKLIGYLVNLYNNPKLNKNGAQLIFTSHDLMTLSSEFLRRDEIWFVAKNGEESSQLYSLIEFKKENGKSPRKDEKYGKQYIEGRYGSDPYLQKMTSWGESDGKAE